MIHVIKLTYHLCLRWLGFSSCMWFFLGCIFKYFISAPVIGFELRVSADNALLLRCSPPISCTQSYSHTFGHQRPILIKEVTRVEGGREEGGRCGHADVATVTAMSADWEMEGSRLERRSEGDDVRRIQMRPCSSPC